ncbi:Hypothetical protein, putative, partial [Bodo saltans]
AHFREYSHTSTTPVTATTATTTTTAATTPGAGRSPIPAPGPKTTILFPAKRLSPSSTTEAGVATATATKGVYDEDGLLVMARKPSPPSSSITEGLLCTTPPPARKIPSTVTLTTVAPASPPALTPRTGGGGTLLSSPSVKRGRSAAGDDAGVDWTSLFSPPPQCTLSLMAPMATTPKITLEGFFGMPYPAEDLFALLSVARKICPADPLNAFPGWRLVGPMEVLAGTVMCFKSDEAKWRYARFRYDPPEVQTIAVSTKSATKYTHIALHRDDPKEPPTMIVAGRRGKPTSATGLLPAPSPIDASGVVTVVEDSVFDVLGDTVGGVFIRLVEEDSCSRTVASLLASTFSTSKQRGKSAADTYKLRKKAMVASTVHHLGAVVPYDHKTELGYRPMMMTMAAFQSLITTWNEKGKGIPAKQLDTITEQFQWADIANDD